MAVFLILVAVIFLGAAIIRRAAPIGVAACAAWAVWQATSDIVTTCIVAIVALVVAAGLCDVAASGPSRSLRTITIGIELVTASAASAWLAFSVWQDAQNEIALFIVAIGAGLFGAGFVLEQRMFSRQCNET